MSRDETPDTDSGESFRSDQLVVAVVILADIAYFGAYAAAYSSTCVGISGDSLRAWDFFWGVPRIFVMATLGIFVVVAIINAVREERDWAEVGTWSLATFFAVASFVVAGIASDAVVDYQLSSFSDESRPVVDAIENYSRDHGRPPPSLGALVGGDYLSETPRTGLCVAPYYEYVPGPRPKGRSWELRVELDFDSADAGRLVYKPEREASDSGDRYGDWVRTRR